MLDERNLARAAGGLPIANLVIRFFGQLAEQFGSTRNALIPDRGCTIGELRISLGSGDPLLQKALAQPGVKAAVADEVVDENFWLKPGQEIEFFAPLSGG